MTRKETAEVIAKLMKIYELDESRIDGVVDIWSKVFEDTEYWRVDRAVDRYIAQDIREYPRFPNPGVINALLPTGW